MDKLCRLLYGVALLLGVLLLLACLDLLFPPALVGRKVGLLAPIPRVRSGGPRKQELSFYGAIQPACFLGQVAPAPPRQRPGRRAPAPPRLFVLRGTMIHSDPARSCAFIDLPGKGGQQAFFPGDKVQGAELTQVGEDQVILRKGTQTIRLEVSLEEAAPRGFPGRKQPEGRKEGGQPPTVEQVLARHPQLRPFWQQASQKQKEKFRQALELPQAKRTKAIRAIIRRSRQR